MRATPGILVLYIGAALRVLATVALIAFSLLIVSWIPADPDSMLSIWRDLFVQDYAGAQEDTYSYGHAWRIIVRPGLLVLGITALAVFFLLRGSQKHAVMVLVADLATQLLYGQKPIWSVLGLLILARPKHPYFAARLARRPLLETHVPEQTSSG